MINKLPPLVVWDLSSADNLPGGLQNYNRGSPSCVTCHAAYYGFKQCDGD